LAQEKRNKLKSQLIPIRFVDTETQTIRLLEQNTFENYFAEDMDELLKRLYKFSRIREKAMVLQGDNEKKFTIIKNTCVEINEVLFKLLMMILKGEKF
jgi:hypothetical protein